MSHWVVLEAFVTFCVKACPALAGAKSKVEERLLSIAAEPFVPRNNETLTGKEFPGQARDDNAENKINTKRLIVQALKRK